MKKWCYWQCKCIEDTEDSFTCTADMICGRAYKCPYNSNEDRSKSSKQCSDYIKCRECD